MSDTQKINLDTVLAVINHAQQYDDDPEELALLLASATVMVVGLAEIELDSIIETMTAIYPHFVKASATIQGYPTTTQ